MNVIHYIYILKDGIHAFISLDSEKTFDTIKYDDSGDTGPDMYSLEEIAPSGPQDTGSVRAL